MESTNSCIVGTKNTGQTCVQVLKTTNRLIAVPKYDSTGALNSIDLTSGPFDSAFFSALVNQSDFTKRWFPIPKMKNIKDMREASLMQTFDDNSKVFLQQGIRNFTGLMIAQDAPPQMVSKLESMRGQNMAFYFVDMAGNLSGQMFEGDTTHFYPIPCESDTIDVIFGKTTNKEIQQIAFSFDTQTTVKDGNIRTILAGSLTAVDLNDLTGLVDVYSSYSNPTGTGVTINLFTDGGDPINPVVVSGLTIRDFRLYNVTGSVALPIDTFVETTPGSYTIVYDTAPIGTDVVSVTIHKDGYDFTAVLANTYHA